MSAQKEDYRTNRADYAIAAMQDRSDADHDRNETLARKKKSPWLRDTQTARLAATPCESLPGLKSQTAWELATLVLASRPPAALDLGGSNYQLRPYGCVPIILAGAYICRRPVPCLDSEPPPVRPGVCWPTPSACRAARLLIAPDHALLPTDLHQAPETDRVGLLSGRVE